MHGGFAHLPFEEAASGDVEDQILVKIEMHNDALMLIRTGKGGLDRNPCRRARSAARSKDGR